MTMLFNDNQRLFTGIFLVAREILRGKNPNDFVVKPTDAGRLQFNLRTAERLDVQLPYGIIKRADVVVR